MNFYGMPFDKKVRMECATTALGRSIYRKNARGQIKNYRLVRLLNGFSKVYKRFLHNSLSKFTDEIF